MDESHVSNFTVDRKHMGMNDVIYFVSPFTGFSTLPGTFSSRRRIPETFRDSRFSPKKTLSDL